MEVLEKSLCSNCIHTPTCSLKNGRPVQECNEHMTAEIASIAGGFVESAEKQNKTQHFQGLCATCDLANHCRWRSEEQVVFHCEHYQ